MMMLNLAKTAAELKSSEEGLKSSSAALWFSVA